MKNAFFGGREKCTPHASVSGAQFIWESFFCYLFHMFTYVDTLLTGLNFVNIGDILVWSSFKSYVWRAF